MRKDNEKHESYGMLSIGRTTCSHDQILFGSSIPHRNTIRLTIAPGAIRRDLSTDWYYAEGREYIEVEMSQSQFAEAITSLNIGSGVPVTVRYVNGQKVASPDFTNKRLQFDEEFRHKMNGLSASLKQLTTDAEAILRDKKTINKGDRELILKQLERLHMEISSNIPFVASSFTEQLDKTTIETKGEIEAFTLNKIHQLGLNKLDELQTLAEQTGKINDKHMYQPRLDNVE